MAAAGTSTLLRNAGPGAGPEMYEGERVVLRAALSSRWACMRACTCCCVCTTAFSGIPLCGIAYLLCGGSARRAEEESFEMLLTPTAIYFKQKQYALGCCCQNTVNKTIPLDKIQDIMLVSTCIGDTCGFAESGRPWQLHVQTAGMSGPEARAELVVYCLDRPEEFRSAVLAAKRNVLAAAAGAITGAGKDDVVVATAGGGGGGGGAAGGAGVGGVGGGDQRAVVAVLERIETAVREGLARMPRAS